ncbi:MAG TPA: DUF5693 family protein [Sphingobacteriaceae bacterium]|nr:DUF5693 family protein [Sphingobacteriaceae bacterium]
MGRGTWAARLLGLFLIIATVTGLAAAGHTLWLRHRAEKANRTVELAADFRDFMELARQDDLDPREVWAALREAGVTTLALNELTLGRLVEEGLVTALAGSRLLSRPGYQQEAAPALAELVRQGQVRAEHTYLLIPDEELAEFVGGQLCRRLRQPCAHHQAAGSPPVLEVPMGLDNLKDMGMGIWPRDLALARDLGMLVIPRLEDYPTATPASITEDFAALAEADVRTVVFNGRAVLGAAADLVDVTAEQFRRRGLVPGAIESVTLLAHFPQAGMTELVEALDYQAARVYSIAPEYQNQLTSAELAEIWARSPWERNIRILYIRPYADGPPGMNLERTLTAIEDAVAGLERAGYTFGPAGTFPPFSIPPAYRWAMAGLVVATALGLLWHLGLVSPTWLLALGLGAWGGWAALAYIGFGDALYKLTALAAALLAPLAAFHILFHRWRRRWPGEGHDPAGPGLGWRGALAGVADLLVVSGASLAGGLLVAALLGDLPYLLEFEYFRGVKAALLLPPAAVALLYLWHLGLVSGSRLRELPARGRERLAAVLREGAVVLGVPINVGHAVLAGLLAAAALLVLLRSGNQTRDVVPQWELQLRTLLETLLAVRPRFKEFALGHPILVVAGWALARIPGPWLALLAVAGAVGQSSLINTFSHLRTPLAISLWRTGHGLWLGILLGLLGVLALEVAWRLWRRLWGRSSPAARKEI